MLERMWREEHFHIASGIANWYKHSGNQSGGFLEKLEIVLPEDPAILLLGIYLNYVPPYNKDVCSTMFIKALFFMARSWEKKQMSLIQKRHREIWFTHTYVKNEDIMSFAGNGSN